MSHDWPTDERTVYGVDMAQMVAWRLAAESMWFEVMPMPDGFWVFTFKDEGISHIVDKTISESMDEIQS